MSQVQALGYIGCSVRDRAAWEKMLISVFGMRKCKDSPVDSDNYSMDARHHRLSLQAGERDRLDYIGWEVVNSAELDAIANRLVASGIGVVRGDAALCAQRHVSGLIQFVAPDNVNTEIFYGADEDNKHFTPANERNGFNTGELGMGHVVLIADKPEYTINWYREMLGFRLTDYINWDDIEATFLHCNNRHHSLAFTNPVMGMQGGDLGHFMLEANSLVDVGRAYDMVLEEDYPLGLTLGQHSNDKTLSFYLYTPSGWLIEYGYGGCLVDDSDWDVKTYDSPKLWGHNFLPPPAGMTQKF